MRVFSYSAALLSAAALAVASNVVDLDTKNFDKLIGQDKPALVEFFAPWCGHCKNLAPVYEQLADAFPSDKVIIAKTDADGVGRELGNRFEVQGFPTLKWFPAGSSTPVDYTGGRDLDSLAAFVTEKSSVKSTIKPPPPPAAVQLTPENFDDVALNKDKGVLVAFTAPWCGHCKNMKPAYEAVARAFSSESKCVVAQMNADDDKNRPIAQKYDVRSFPTIKFFPKGEDKTPINYSSGRTEAQFIEFLNEHCGTSRTLAGQLSDVAGRFQALDIWAKKFAIAPEAERPQVLQTFHKYIATLRTEGEQDLRAGADYYVRVMDRVVTKGQAWLIKEQARLAGLLGSPSLAPTKLDEIKIKVNIIGAFLGQKAAEAGEAAANVAGGAKDNAQKILEKVGDFAQQVQDKAVHSEL